MERLTKYNTGKGHYVSAIGSGHGCWTRIINQLAAYENTGLTPEQVAAMKVELQDERYRHDRQADFTVGQAQEIDRLKEQLRAYKEAEREGRLVVLPCGPGAELTRDGKTFKADHWNINLTAFRDEFPNGGRLHVALFSVEEAERALLEVKP